EIQAAFDGNSEEPGKKDGRGCDFAKPRAFLQGNPDEATNGENGSQPMIVVLPAVHVVQGHLPLSISDLHPMRCPISKDLLAPGTGFAGRPDQAESERQIKEPDQGRFALTFQSESQAAAQNPADQA